MINEILSAIRQRISTYQKKMTIKISCSTNGTAHFSLYPTLMGSKTPTSKFSESKKVRWGSGCPLKSDWFN
ncbi:hypothetical protein COL10_27610 [Bacillus cereus]|nr:hypothetical protein COL10_27610 [Bacillus cereus]